MASLSSVSTLAASSADLNLNLTVRPGDDVTLICQAPDGVDIAAVEWRRTDLKKEEPVFLYRDGHIESDVQHPSFKNRVELKDKKMKDGDLSVILKNVKEEDSGIYECRFKDDGAKREKRSLIKAPPISTIRLEVEDPALNLNLTARPGDDVTLSCRAPDGVDIAAAEWSRNFQKILENVFLHRDGHIDSFNQHPSFKNRVELKDKEMKDGDLSVILRNVTEEDSGKYKCRFKAADDYLMQRNIFAPISTIRLEVVDPDSVNGREPAGIGSTNAVITPSAAAGLTVASLFVVLFSVVAAWIYRKQRRSGKRSQASTEAA